jgi:hypothetical protein
MIFLNFFFEDTMHLQYVWLTEFDIRVKANDGFVLGPHSDCFPQFHTRARCQVVSLIKLSVYGTTQLSAIVGCPKTNREFA